MFRYAAIYDSAISILSHCLRDTKQEIRAQLEVSKIYTNGTIGHAGNRLADVLLGSHEDGTNDQQEDGDARM